MTAVEPEPAEAQRPGLLLRLIRDQRVAFLIVGGINTAVGFGFFILADLIVGPAIDKNLGAVAGSLIVLVISHVLGVMVAFTLHRRFVFKVTGHVLRDLVRFESVYLVALGINAVALPLLVELGIQRIIAQGMILVVSTLLSYFGHRHFSFRRPMLGVLADEDLSASDDSEKRG